eukprot:scaffold308557_cov35-Prasinocladus_malaysianus.AAC.1
MAPTTLTLRQPAAGRVQLQTSRRNVSLRARRNVLVMAKASDATYAEAKEACADLVKKASCAPILVRLACLKEQFVWPGRHDSGNYDASTGTGGANGSIRFDLEMSHAGNAGLPNALRLLAPIKKKFPDISHADLFQMASATAIEVSGGPVIDMKYGRIDAADESAVPPDGRLPNADVPFQEAQGPEPSKESEDQ